MIRTSLIYFIADACIDRLFDPIYVALMVDPVQPLRKLDRLAWIDFFDEG